MEDRLYEYKQENQLDSLVFVRVKQTPCVDLKVTMHNIINDKMGFSAYMSDRILSIQCIESLQLKLQMKVELPL